jgi:putative ABC transport system ATP-binding protein
MTGPLVQVEKLSKTFGAGQTAVRALADVDLTVGPGEVVGLKGPSGSGKSTLLNLIACIQEPTDGKLSLGGETVPPSWIAFMLTPLVGIIQS